jgi:hypothetical protein
MRIKYTLTSNFDAAELKAPTAPVRVLTAAFGWQPPIGCRLIVEERRNG